MSTQCKYSVTPLENYIADGGEKQGTITYYKEILSATDHIPNKIVEQLVEDLADATPLNILESFIKFIAAVRLEYREVLQCRKNAREKINELEKMSDV